MLKNYYERIDYHGELNKISELICKDYNIGNFISNDILTTGYEDFNYILETSTGKFVVKILAKERTDSFAKRYVETIQKAIEIGVNHPKLFESNQGLLYFLNIDFVKLRVMVIEYIDGRDFYNLNYVPDRLELRIIAKQMSLIHQIDIKPDFIYDTWATINFGKEFEKKSSSLSEEDNKLLEPLYKDFMKLNIAELPHCYVHGDIISTNVLKDKNEKLWIIDFAVSNYYPRIVDIAVTTCNLCFDEKDKHNSDIRANVLLDEYQKNIILTEKEKEALPLFIKIAHSMHVLIASYYKAENMYDSDENEYWVLQGRKGLLQMNE